MTLFIHAHDKWSLSAGTEETISFLLKSQACCNTLLTAYGVMRDPEDQEGDFDPANLSSASGHLMPGKAT